jgi:hypothetical protein
VERKRKRRENKKSGVPLRRRGKDTNPTMNEDPNE